MTIKEAWDAWSKETDNQTLANKSRLAFSSVVLKNYGDMDLSEINKENAETIIGSKLMSHEYKVKAASILAKLLWFGFYHNLCKAPRFEYQDILPLATEPPAPSPFVKRKVKTAQEVFDMVTTPREPKNKIEKLASKLPAPPPKKKGGRPGDKVCKISPDTFEVMETFDSITEAQQQMGGIDLHKALYKGYKCHDFYWCKKPNLKTFTDNLKAKQAKAEAKKPEKRKERVAKIKAEREAVVKKSRKEFEQALSDTVSNVLAKATLNELLQEIQRRGAENHINITITITL